MTVDGKKIFSKAKVSINGDMVINTTENSIKEEKKGSVFTHGKKETNMKVPGNKVKRMVKEPYSILKVIKNMKGNLKMVR